MKRAWLRDCGQATACNGQQCLHRTAESDSTLTWTSPLTSSSSVTESTWSKTHITRTTIIAIIWIIIYYYVHSLFSRFPPANPLPVNVIHIQNGDAFCKIPHQIYLYSTSNLLNKVEKNHTKRTFVKQCKRDRRKLMCVR